MSSTALYDALTQSLHGLVLKPGDEDYERNNSSYFSAFQNELKPSYIVRPTSTNEVQTLIKSIRPFLLQGMTRLAVRGNGHTPSAGASNIQDAVTIDLGGFKGVSVNENKDLVTISAGETWLSVYTELEKHGLTTAGGRVGRVGVSGLVLGGGLSFHSTRRGFACDSVIDFEVVVASGEIVHANASNNTDLYTALKGGLSNFGIVTSFTMRTFSSADLWGGIMFYMPGTFAQHIQNTCDFVRDEKDEDTHLICSVGFGYGHQAVTCCMYSTKGVESPLAFRSFLSVEPQIEQMCTMRTKPQSDFCDELSKLSTDGGRQFYMTCTIRCDSSLMNLFHDKWQQTLSRIKDTDGLLFTLGFQPLTKTLLRNSTNAGGNTKGLSAADGPLFIVLLNPVWKSASDDGRIIREVSDIMARFKQLATERSLLHQYIFPNYAYGDQDVLGGYGEGMLASLQAVSRKWDPDRIFQKFVPGGFKLPKYEN